MSAASPSPRLLQLLSRLSDGLIDPAEAAELDEILRKDSGARDYYRCHAAVDVGLGAMGDAGKVIAFPRDHRARRWPVFAAAAVLALSAGMAWWWNRAAARGTQDPLADHLAVEETVLAVTSAADQVQWSLPRAPEGGQRLGAGIVRVLSGDLTLSLAGGQAVHVRGPAEFELLPDKEFALRGGRAAFRTLGSQGPFIVHLAKGALVDMGSEYSVNVEPGGAAEVRVFEKELIASTIGASGRTLEELQLVAGKSVLINAALSPGSRPAADFLRVPLAPLSVSPASGKAYAAAVLGSTPAAYWRFEELDTERRVADETGKYPLQLMERSRLGGDAPRRFLNVDGGDAAGFAMTREGIAGLDTARGMTVECLIFSAAENYGTAVALEETDPVPGSVLRPGNVNHAPQIFALERMGRKGEHIGHIHPDFALRGLFRSPGGYVGGTNIYSRQSHLLHRWVHVAAVHEGKRILLYVDGEISDEATVSLPFNNVNLRPIIGRLQPNPKDELRQWLGGIDEVALYDRALSASEIRAHFAVLKP